MSGLWSAEQNPNYRSRDDDRSAMWILRYDPTPDGKRNEDGTTSYSMNFPALQLTEWVSEPEKVAPQLATILNAHDAMEEALKEAERFMAYFAGETSNAFEGPGTPTSCVAMIRAAISKASPTHADVRVE